MSGHVGNCPGYTCRDCFFAAGFAEKNYSNDPACSLSAHAARCKSVPSDSPDVSSPWWPAPVGVSEHRVPLCPSASGPYRLDHECGPSRPARRNYLHYLLLSPTPTHLATLTASVLQHHGSYGRLRSQGCSGATGSELPFVAEWHVVFDLQVLLGSGRRDTTAISEQRVEKSSVSHPVPHGQIGSRGAAASRRTPPMSRMEDRESAR